MMAIERILFQRCSESKATFAPVLVGRSDAVALGNLHIAATLQAGSTQEQHSGKDGHHQARYEERKSAVGPPCESRPYPGK
jgi:hypothetical protein